MKYLLILLLLLPTAYGLDRFFYIKGSDSPYTTEPGGNVTVGFELVNKELESPKNVEVYIEGCPATWFCTRGNYEYNDSGTHHENLTILIPLSAEIKSYTFYLRLRSDYPTTRGDDRITLIVGQRETKPPTPKRNPALQTVREVQMPVPEPEEPLILIPEPESKVEEVKQNLEKLEKDSGFLEYATGVLMVLLVVVGIGGARAWYKNQN